MRPRLKLLFDNILYFIEGKKEERRKQFHRLFRQTREPRTVSRFINKENTYVSLLSEPRCFQPITRTRPQNRELESYMNPSSHVVRVSRRRKADLRSLAVGKLVAFATHHSWINLRQRLIYRTVCAPIKGSVLQRVPLVNSWLLSNATRDATRREVSLRDWHPTERRKERIVYVRDQYTLISTVRILDTCASCVWGRKENLGRGNRLSHDSHL